MIKYRVVGIEKNKILIDRFVEFNSEHEAYETGSKLLQTLPEITKLRVDLIPKGIEEIGNSSYLWESKHGKLEFSRLSNCD